MNDKLQQLYDLYKQKGIISTTDFNTFASASDDQRQKLYDLGVQKGLFNTTDYNTFNTAWSGSKQEPVKKKESTVLESKSEDGSSVSQKTKEEVFFLPNDPSQLYTKKGNEWYKKIGSNYLPLTKGDVAQRSAYLNQNAQKASQFDIDRAAQSQTSVDTKKLYAQDTKELKKSFEQKYGEVKSLEKINEAKRQEELKKQVPQESEKLNFRAGGGKIYDFDNENEVEEYKDIAPAYYMAYYDNNGKPLAMMDPEKMKEAEANMKKDFGDKEFAAYMSIDKIPSAKKLSSLGEQATSDVLNKQFEGTNLKFERSGSELIITSQLGYGINAAVLNEKTIDLSEPDADKKLKSFISHNIVKKSEREKFDNLQSVEDLVELVGSKPYKFRASLLEDMNVDKYFERERQLLDVEMARAKADTYGTDLKSYEQKVIKFNQDVKGGKMSKADFDAKSAELENERKSLLQRKDIMSKAIVKAEKIDKLTSNLEKANAITAEERERQGSFLGNISRGFGEGLIDVSQAGIDFAISAGSALTDAKTFADAITPGEYERLRNLGYSDDEIKNEIQKSVKSTANKVLGTVPDVFGFGTTEEYSKSADRGVIDQAAFAIGESLGAVAGGIAMAPAKAGTTAGFFSMSYNGLEDQMRGPQFDALSENEKKIMSVPYGLVIGALEKLGAKVATGAAESKTLSMFSEYIMSKTFSSLPKNASLLEIKSAIDKSVAASVANGMLKITGAGLVEGGTEFTQQIFEGVEKDVANRIIQSNQLEKAKEEGGGSVSKEIYNQIIENKFFKDAADLSSLDGIQQLLKESGNAFVVGALAGGMGGAMSVGVAEPISNKVSNNKFAIYRDIILDDAAREGAISSINKKVDNDQITREQADEEIKSINEAYPALRQIPTNFSVGAQREAFGLLMERESLDKEIKDKDPNLVAKQKERVAEINEQLKGLSYAVQKQGADAVPVQSGAGVSQQMEEGKPATEPQGVTGETITEKVEVEGPKAEQPQAEVAQEERQRLVDQYVQEQTDLINNYDEDTFSPERKQELIDELVSDPIAHAEGARRSEIEFGFDYDSSAKRFLSSIEEQDAIDALPVVQPTERIEFTQETLPAELQNVEPVGTTTTKRSILGVRKGETKLTYTGQQLIDAGLRKAPKAVQPAAETATTITEVAQPTAQAQPTAKIETIEVQEVPQVDQTLNDLTQQNNVITQNDFTAARIRNVGKEKVVAQVARAAKAIAKVLPKVKIVVHATPEAFVEATKDMDGRLSEGGLYDRKTGQIHINLEKATNRTVAHEVFHALILSRVNTDLDAQRLTRSMIGAVRKSLKKAEGTAELMSYLEDFESNYDENIKNEEKLAELFAVLADNYKQLPPASKNVIIRFLNRLAKALGLKEMTDREAIEFMNTLSRKVEIGQEIEAREVGKQKEGKAAVRKQKTDVVKSKINEDYDHVITLNGKEIGKIFYDKSQKTWNNSDFDRRGVKPNTYQWVYGDIVGENKQEAINEMVRRYKEKEAKPTPKTEEAKIKYTNDQVTNSFLNALNEKSNVSKNTIDNKSFIYGDKASLELSRFDKGDRNEIAIQSISTFDKGKGVGKQVMKDITDTADDLGITLTLDAKPFGNEGLSKEQLINFYKNNGFVADIEEMFGGEFESEEELIDYVVNEEPDVALQMTREPSDRQFAVRKQKLEQNQEFKNSAFFFGGFFTGIQKQGIGKSIINDIFKNNPKLENILLYTQDDAIGFWKKVGGEIVKQGNDKNGIVRYFVKINRESVPKSKNIKELSVSYKNTNTKNSKIDKGEYSINYGRQKIGFFFVNDLGTIKTDPKNIIEETNFAVRKQKTTGPSRIVENGVKAGKTDAEIRQEGKAAGFTNKEMTEALSKYYTKEQKVFMKSGVKGLVGRFVDGARRFKQQFLTSKGLLPKIGFTYKEKMEGEISAEANRAAKTAKKFGVLFDKFTGDKELLLKAFDKALRGDKSIQLPAGFAALANEMRNHIDRLSQMLIATGAVEGDMADAIRENMGTYITRSYEIFDNKNFRQKVGEQELQAAKNFLRTQPGMIALAQAEAARTGVTVDEALDVLVDNKIDEYFADAETGALVKGSKLGSKDLSTLKERKEIPEQIRMLMGEYSDPAMNYARTVLNISTLAARHQFLTQVKEAGMGKFFFEKNDSQRPKGFDTEIASEGSDTMSPLNGLMTTPEIAEAFGIYEGQKGEDSWIQKAIKIYYKAMALVKHLKTIESVSTHMKNIFGNFGFVAVNGHSLIEIGKAIKVVAQDLKTMSKPEVETKIDEYIKAGIMRQGAGVNEIRDMFKDADMDGFLERRLSMKKPNKGVVGKIKQAISSRGSKIISAMEDAYQAEDDMFKIAAYETEMNRYADALYNKSKDQLTDKEKQEVSDIAANNVKNTYPTYSRIPEGIKRLRRFPLFIGSFISFQAEAYRTAYNTIALAKDELSSDNKKIKAIAARRIAGASTYLTAKTAMLSYAGYAAGTGIGGVLGALFDDDDEKKKEKDVRSFLPPWSQNSDIIVLKAADGEIEYIDFSASDPHGGINKALNAFLKGDDLLDSFKQSTLELVGQFQGPDILTNLAIQLKGNENDFGKPIYNEEDSFAEKTDKIIDYVYKVVEPGTITSIRKAVGSEQSLGQIAFGEATGLKIRKSNVKDQFGYKLPEFDESFKDIRKIYNSEYYKSLEMQEDPKATKKDIKDQNTKTDEALVRANEKYAAKAKELMDLINSANRLGVDYDELINELGFIKSTMGKSNISEMENGGDEFIKEKEY